MQKQDGKENTIMFASRELIDAKRYNPTEVEALAIVFGLKDYLWFGQQVLDSY